MRRFDLLDDLTTVATPRRPWPSRTGARRGRSPKVWLVPLTGLVLGSMVLVAI